ncbi:MAG: hypothetical protein LKM32_03115 [Chiayiivirga sp.]|uniref:hypothetical protein n=1 Tax=Chiayiivirga sp. TaxID=2041042 RepID=UPI0025B8D223|nr:hypothetical protein [Chiayiivirga sp.]MCI1710734.1 hypothetical protein [Chiayiivirga sp.]MCI1728426.1 hypothetical protein [Chiayiivirga sp.]
MRLSTCRRLLPVLLALPGVVQANDFCDENPRNPASPEIPRDDRCFADIDLRRPDGIPLSPVRDLALGAQDGAASFRLDVHRITLQTATSVDFEEITLAELAYAAANSQGKGRVVALSLIRTGQTVRLQADLLATSSPNWSYAGPGLGPQASATLLDTRQLVLGPISEPLPSIDVSLSPGRLTITGPHASAELALGGVGVTWVPHRLRAGILFASHPAPGTGMSLEWSGDFPWWGRED